MSKLKQKEQFDNKQYLGNTQTHTHWTEIEALSTKDKTLVDEIFSGVGLHLVAIQSYCCFRMMTSALQKEIITN